MAESVGEPSGLSGVLAVITETLDELGVTTTALFPFSHTLDDEDQM